MSSRRLRIGSHEHCKSDTDRPAARLPVHLDGQPAELSTLCDLARAGKHCRILRRSFERDQRAFQMRIDQMVSRLAQDSTYVARWCALVLAGPALGKVGNGRGRTAILEINEFKFIY